MPVGTVLSRDEMDAEQRWAPCRERVPQTHLATGAGKSPLGDMAPEQRSTLPRGSGRSRHACSVREVGDGLA